MPASSPPVTITSTPGDQPEREPVDEDRRVLHTVGEREQQGRYDDRDRRTDPARTTPPTAWVR